MPITTTHPEYDQHIECVKKTSDALDGDVKEYVPRKESQTSQQYEVFRSRPSFYNVMERTTSALVGALTRKPLRLEGVYGDVPVICGGESVEQFVQQGYVDLLTTGRVGLLCDYDEGQNTPYIVSYASEYITNWSDTYVVLREHYYVEDPDDRFKVSVACRFRELYLDQDGLYAVNVWTETKKDVWEVTEHYEPLARGQRLMSIPFVFVNAYDNKPCMVKPPLATLANINIEHFNLQAQMSHVTWVLSFPVPVITGELAQETAGIGFGGDKFLQLTEGSTATFLEYQGNNVKVIQEQIKVKEEQMFSLGSRLLQYKAGVESSDSLQIRLGAEGASLITMANSFEEGLEKILSYYNLWWVTDGEEPEVYLNKDFSPAVMTPAEIGSLIDLYTKGLITQDTFLKRLYEGEVVDDPNQEKEALIENTPADPAA